MAKELIGTASKATVGVRGAKAVVVMPAYNAATTLSATLSEIPKGLVEKVILVDDASRDGTAWLASSLGLVVIAHPHNAGYGANQKTCYMEALREDADVIVMLHPDGQYDPGILDQMIAAVRDGTGDIVLGSRFMIRGGPATGGMPWWKRMSNRVLTFIENLVLHRRLSECHTGYRAYSRKFLQTVPFLRNSNDFVFDTQILFQAVAFGFTIAEVPVSSRYFPGASSVNFIVSLKYGIKTVGVALRYLLHRLGWRSRLFQR